MYDVGTGSHSGLTRRAFSILELIISLAIIAVLVAILLPVLAQARSTGRRTVCAANLRQIGAAFQAYSQDNRRFPVAEAAPDWHYGGVAFVGADRTPMLAGDRPINPYFGDASTDRTGGVTALFRCPDDRGVWALGASAQRPGPAMYAGRTCFSAFGNSYRANALLMDSTSAGIDALHRPLTELDVNVGHSRLLVAGDAVWHYATAAKPDPDSLLDASWHTDFRGGNFVAMDSSVRYTVFSTDPSTVFTLLPRVAPTK